MNRPIWDETFITGKVADQHKKFADAGSDQAKALACAIALEGWSACIIDQNIPETFGTGMSALADWSGLSLSDLLPGNAEAVAKQSLLAMRSVRGNQQDLDEL